MYSVYALCNIFPAAEVLNTSSGLILIACPVLLNMLKAAGEVFVPFASAGAIFS